MKCLNCGAEIDATSKFCGYCGSPVQQQVPSMNLEFQNNEQVTDNINSINNRQEIVNSVETEVKEEPPVVLNPFNSNIQPEHQIENPGSNLFEAQTIQQP